MDELDIIEPIDVIETEIDIIASKIAKARYNAKHKRAKAIEAMQTLKGTVGYIPPEDLQYGY